MSALKPITVGTRTSALSMVQTEEFLRLLRALHPDREFAVVPLATGGDRHKSAPLLSMARGMFVKEIEVALLNGEIDFAVHSAKDLTPASVDGLVLAAFSERIDPRDVQVNRWGLPFDRLPAGAKLGTSSPRRSAQLRAYRDDVEILPIRGNVDTRMNKAKGADYDGVVLAAAGLARLGRQDEITEYLSPEICTPEPGQGALAIQARASDSSLLELLAAADHKPTNTTVTCERAFLSRIGGGCTVPVAAYARLDGDKLDVLAMAGLPDGSRIYRTRLQCDADDPEAAGTAVAEALMETGAAEIIGKGHPG